MAKVVNEQAKTSYISYIDERVITFIIGITNIHDRCNEKGNVLELFAWKFVLMDQSVIDQGKYMQLRLTNLMITDFPCIEYP